MTTQRLVAFLNAAYSDQPPTGTWDEFVESMVREGLAADPAIAADMEDAPRLRTENARLRGALELVTWDGWTDSSLAERIDKARAALTEGEKS